QLPEAVVAPGPGCAVSFDRQAVIVARRDRADTRQAAHSDGAVGLNGGSVAKSRTPMKLDSTRRTHDGPRRSNCDRQAPGKSKGGGLKSADFGWGACRGP